MAEIKAKLVEKIERTPTVSSFRFFASDKINFIPGQFLQVIFDEDNRSNSDLNKYLSFSCPPDKGYIEVTKRLSESAFSQKLKNLKVGDEVLLKVPLGSCVFKEEYGKIAFLIGGIGITPVISIIGYIADKQLANDVILLYSNRNSQEIAFKAELDAWQAKNSNIKIVYVISEGQPQDKNCIFGCIDKDLVIARVNDYAERVFFIFGPPKMVEAMQDLCLEIGCSKENIKTEKFIGY